MRGMTEGTPNSLSACTGPGAWTTAHGRSRWHRSQRWCLVLLAGLSLQLSGAAASAATQTGAPEAQSTAAELRVKTQELLDAVAPGRVEVWEKYLDPELVHIDENGVRRSRSELLKEIQPLPPGLVGSISIDRFVVRDFGDWAVVDVEMQEQLDYFGQPLRSRFRSMDTWRRTASGWKLVGQHVSAVLKDPPATAFDPGMPCEYAGSYVLTADRKAELRCVADGLEAQREGRPAVTYKREVGDVFFVPGQPRTRRIFVRNQAGRITGFVDRREGEDVGWTRVR